MNNYEVLNILDKSWSKQRLIEKIKRGQSSEQIVQNFINENKGTKLLLVTSDESTIFKFNYYSLSGKKKIKEIIVDEFVGVKGWKSIGNKVGSYKRMSGFEVISLNNENNIDIVDDSKNEGTNLNLFE